MDWMSIEQALVALCDTALLALLAYGAFLVAGGGGFRRDAPEDAAAPYLDLSLLR